MITSSYSSSIRARISSSFQTSETVGAGLSSKSDLGLPTITSSFEPLDQGEATNALLKTGSFGVWSTSATEEVMSAGAASPLVASH